MTHIKSAYLLFVFFLFFGPKMFAQSLTDDDVQYVKDFIQNIKCDNRATIASEALYPIRRRYPIPPIVDSVDFVKRFSELFDSNLRNQIIKSTIPKDWAHVGWRGIMLHNGLLWLDEGGALSAVTYESAFEKERRATLIEQDRATLHSSIRAYDVPIGVVTTKTFRIRIDQLKDGSYRYTSWKKNTAVDQVPELKLTGGKRYNEGSGGNHSYTFTQGPYQYVIQIVLMGADDDPPAVLTVYKGKKVILNQSGSLVGG